jgi:hypothetical protein
VWRSRAFWLAIAVSLTLHGLFALSFLSRPVAKNRADSPLTKLFLRSDWGTTSVSDHGYRVAPTLSEKSQLPLTDKHSGTEPKNELEPIATTLGDNLNPIDSGRYYFNSNEVDTAATPIAEFSIDTENIQLGELIILSLRIFLSSDGHIDLYDVLSSTADEEKTKILLRTFELTAFTPALIEGQRVPSVREIEITIDTTMHQQGQLR